LTNLLRILEEKRHLFPPLLTQQSLISNQPSVPSIPLAIYSKDLDATQDALTSPNMVDLSSATDPSLSGQFSDGFFKPTVDLTFKPEQVALKYSLFPAPQQQLLMEALSAPQKKSSSHLQGMTVSEPMFILPSHMANQSECSSPDSGPSFESLDEDWLDDLSSEIPSQPNSPCESSDIPTRTRPELLTQADLAKHFHKKASAAAQSLAISITTLKKICRRLGIRRWPFRKVQMVGRNLAKVDRLRTLLGPTEMASYAVGVPDMTGRI